MSELTLGAPARNDIGSRATGGMRDEDASAYYSLRVGVRHLKSRWVLCQNCVTYPL